jgi:nicotinate-nucleotide adenylyltransferase
MHVASCGLRELALDRIWWITSKQNPLKNKQTEYNKRVNSIKSLGLKKRMEINHIERKMNIQYSIQMIKALKVRSPNTKFIFLMGADNLSQFNKWKSWKEITLLVPIAVIARPGYGLKSQLSPTARYLSDHRVPEHKAHTLKYESPPTWTFITPPLNKNSSSTIRKDIANA